MTGRGYRKSAEVAAAIGPYDEYEKNREPHNDVMRMHRDAAYEIPDGQIADEDLLDAARRSWDEAVAIGERARLPQRAGDGARADRDDLAS